MGEKHWGEGGSVVSSTRGSLDASGQQRKWGIMDENVGRLPGWAPMVQKNEPRQPASALSPLSCFLCGDVGAHGVI